MHYSSLKFADPIRRWMATFANRFSPPRPVSRCCRAYGLVFSAARQQAGNIDRPWRHVTQSALFLATLAWTCDVAGAQEGLGPFMPHEGGTITTAWANAYGPDAEAWIRFANVRS